jgi:predicted DNA-binding transcriptional regulator AlpA
MLAATEASPRPLQIDSEQVAQILGVTVATVRAWRTQGRIPKGTRISHRKVRWNLHEIEAFARTRTLGPDNPRVLGDSPDVATSDSDPLQKPSVEGFLP